ncbi:MAG: metal-dependent hydrolase [Flavobacteriales bacterium]|nr:metal-dependent hydrolase [Flavobacteriales bacterium]
MDSLTHLVVGACIGEVFLGRQLGRRALLWGAFAQSAPDLDVVAALWTDTAENLLAHRGFTHSFLFAAVLTPLFALAADRWHRPHDIRFSRFCWFFGVAIFGHTLLDGLNSYGTGWFEPFSHARVALAYSSLPILSSVWALPWRCWCCYCCAATANTTGTGRGRDWCGAWPIWVIAHGTDP